MKTQPSLACQPGEGPFRILQGAEGPHCFISVLRVMKWPCVSPIPVSE